MNLFKPRGFSCVVPDLVGWDPKPSSTHGGVLFRSSVTFSFFYIAAESYPPPGHTSQLPVETLFQTPEWISRDRSPSWRARQMISPMISSATDRVLANGALNTGIPGPPGGGGDDGRKGKGGITDGP